MDIRKINKNKKIGQALVYTSVIPAIFLNGYLRICVCLSILLISYLFFRKYRCPFCGHIFDPRLDIQEFCNHCGIKINDSSDNHNDR